MRAREFLYEASLAKSSPGSWINYLKNALTAPSISLGDKGEKARDLELTEKSKQQIRFFIEQLDASVPSEIGKLVASIAKQEISFTNGHVATLGQIFKSPEIKSGAADVETGARTTKYWNDGEVAETFLGIALFTRFQSKNDVTAKQVLKSFQSLKAVAGGFQTKGKRKNNPIEMLAINKPANNQVIEAIANDLPGFVKEYPSAAPTLLKLVDAAIAYVNQSTKVSEAIAKADNEPNADKIFIKTDGISDQTGTKADLSLKIGDFERLLSLKAKDVKQFGQDSGASFETIQTFFGRFIPDVNISSLERNWPDMSRAATKSYREQGTASNMFRQVYELIGQAYRTAARTLQDKLQNPATAEEVVEDVYKGIVHHAQGSETKQTLVVLNPSSKKAWVEMEFGDSLQEALQSFKLDVKLITAGGAKDNHVLQVFGRAIDNFAAKAMTSNIKTSAQAQKASVAKTVKKTTDPEMLFQLRSYIQEAGPTMRNIIEMGPLLKTLTEVQQINDVAPQVTPAPIAAPAAPAATRQAVAKSASVPQQEPEDEVELPQEPEVVEPIELGPDDLTN